ncbi:MAG: hypothetical protein AUI42_04595 [Actinobacteria bacterium 13_1_40CM_2_65_8]|nr:MAG: hypothetical protein AUI42_04595 [Actinobacteria bacterium 13_1_40CM_2_65_8]
MDIMRPPASLNIGGVEIVHATGEHGARNARGVVVVIDVLRSFTVSAYALAGGARECLLVGSVDQARSLAERTAGALICAEENALPVPGIPISNSPTQITALDFEGKTLIQRSSAGTPVLGAVSSTDGMFAGSLVVASATAQACLLRRPSIVTLVASADHPEDHACAKYLEALLRGKAVDLDPLLQPLRDSERYRKVMAGQWPGFPPTDIELALAVDRFGFVMPAVRRDSHLVLTAAMPGTLSP